MARKKATSSRSVTAKSSSKGKSKKNKTVVDDSGVVEITISETTLKLLTPVAIILGSILVALAIIYSVRGIENLIKGNDINVDQSADVNQDSNTDDNSNGQDNSNDSQQSAETVGMGNFYEDKSAELCKEGNKAVAMLFSTSTCPHCSWVKDTFDQWAKDNKDKVVAYHYEFQNDGSVIETVSGDKVDVPEEYMSMYEKYGQGYVPTFIFGCKYYRVGNAFEQENNLEKETQAYDEMVNMMLGNN